VKLIVKPAHLEVKFKPGVWVEVPKLLQAIKSSGFAPVNTDVRLTVSGKLRNTDGHFSLELEEMKKPVTLALEVAEEKVRAALQAQEGQAVTLQGVWQAPIGKEKAPQKLSGSLQVREAATVDAESNKAAAPKEE